MSEQLLLVRFGAKSAPLVADVAEAWRLLTTHFVHTGWIHLVFNLAFFFHVGGALELVSRRGDYLSLLVLVGVCSSLFSLIWTPEVSAGASGLVFGVLGAAVSFGLHRRQELRASLQPYFGLWVLPFALFILLIGIGNPRVDHASHLGGLIAGLGWGWSMRLHRASDRRLQADPRTISALCAGICVLVLAPTIARRGEAATLYQLEDGLELSVPATWIQGYGPIGEVRFETASGLVALSIDRVPAGQDEAQHLWYLERHLQEIPPEERRRSLGAARLSPIQTRHALGRLLHLEFAREGTPRSRDVYFLDGRDAPGGLDGRVVLSFETPTEWHGKYSRVGRRVLGTLAPPPGSPTRGQQFPTPVRATALP